MCFKIIVRFFLHYKNIKTGENFNVLTRFFVIKSVKLFTFPDKANNHFRFGDIIR